MATPSRALTSRGSLAATQEFEAELDCTAWSDEALVEAAKIGDATAFEKLVERHNGFCLAKAYSILRNRGDADEEVQTAWVQIWTHLASYRGQGSFGGWVSRIVSNQCLMRLRSMKNAPLVSVDEVFDIEGCFRLEMIDQRALPDEALLSGEASRVLVREIRRIPPLLRDVLVMRDVRRLVLRDIAGHLGISVPATKSRLIRARRELRERLMKHYGGSGCGVPLQKPSRRRVAYVRVN